MRRVLGDAFGGLRRAFGSVRILFGVWGLHFLLALAVALPFHGALDRAMAPRKDALELVPSYSAEFDFDFRNGSSEIFEVAGGTLTVLVFLSFLLGRFVEAGWIGVFHEPRAVGGLRTFFRWGAREWLRFLRVSAFVLLALAVAGWFAHGRPWSFAFRLLTGAEAPDALSSERTAVTFEWAQGALYLGAIAFLLAVGDYAKIAIVESERRSAFFAFFHGLFFVLRHPWRTGLLAASFTGLEMAALALAAVALPALTERASDAWHVIGIFVFLQLVVVCRIGFRGARFAGQLALYRSIQAEAAPLISPISAARHAGL